MNISTVQGSSFATYAQQAHGATKGALTPVNTARNDTVTISDEAKMLSTYAPGSIVVTVGNHEVIVAPDTDGNYPAQQNLEESFDRLARLPPGGDDLIPFATVVVKLGKPNSTDMARREASNALTAQEHKDHGEYLLQVANAFSDEYHSRGMTFSEYENRTRDNKELRDEINLAIRERLEADPRAVELMKEFDIAI